LLIPGVTRFASDEVPEILYQDYIFWLYPAAAIWIIGTLASLYFSYRNQIRKAVITLALSSMLTGQITLAGHDSLSPASSAYHLVPKIVPYLRPGVPFYSVRMYEQTLPFYIKRTVTLVEHQDEMEFGLKQEPQKWIPDVATFEKVWRTQSYALAIMAPETYALLQNHNLPMQLITQDTRRVVVKTP